MWHNLFISIELDKPKAKLEEVAKAIGMLGNTTKLHGNCWYVNSPHSAQDAVRHVGFVLDDKDRLVVVDASENICTWYNIGEKEQVRVRQNWRLMKGQNPDVEQQASEGKPEAETLQ